MIRELGLLKGLYSDFYFFNHGFFTELHRKIKSPAAENKKYLLNNFIFRDLLCVSVVNISSLTPIESLIGSISRA
jgi:hypothetical protein